MNRMSNVLTDFQLKLEPIIHAIIVKTVPKDTIAFSLRLSPNLQYKYAVKMTKIEAVTESRTLSTK
jgi:hypothetical protein